MRLLNFLRVLDAIQSPGRSAAPPRNRKLKLESLERRAVLTLLDTLLPAPEPLTTPLIEVVPLPTISEQSSSLDYGGSGSGSGDPDAQEPVTDQLPEPPTHEIGSVSDSGDSPPGTYSPESGSASGFGSPDPGSITEGGSGSGSGYFEGGSEGGSGSGSGDSDLQSSQGGSGSGTGDGTTDPPPPTGGSGSGTGEAPVITSLQSDRIESMIWLVGSVSDPDGPEGLTVHFIIGNSSTPAFSAIVGADGTFSTIGLWVSPGTQIRAYATDAQGNQSDFAICVVW